MLDLPVMGRGKLKIHFLKRQDEAPAENMMRVLKTFLLWLLIAALPMQGMAAVVATACVIGHQKLVLSSMEHEHAAHSMSMTHDHHDAPQATLNAMESHHMAVAVSEAPPHKHKDAKHSTCTSAACCVGAAMPSSVATWNPASAGSESVALAPPIFLLGFVPPSIDRPPRHRSA